MIDMTLETIRVGISLAVCACSEYLLSIEGLILLLI